MSPPTYIRIIPPGQNGDWPPANGPEIMVEISARQSVNLKAAIGYGLISRTIAIAIEANGAQHECTA
jgi:hypothetical protein